MFLLVSTGLVCLPPSERADSPTVWGKCRKATKGDGRVTVASPWRSRREYADEVGSLRWVGCFTPSVKIDKRFRQLPQGGSQADDGLSLEQTLASLPEGGVGFADGGSNS